MLSLARVNGGGLSQWVLVPCVCFSWPGSGSVAELLELMTGIWTSTSTAPTQTQAARNAAYPFPAAPKTLGYAPPPTTPQHSWRFLFTVDSYLCSVRVPFIDRNGWSELLCLSLWSVFIGEEVLISLSVTEKFGYLHPAEGRLRLDSNRTSRPQRLALGQSVAALLVTLFCRGRRFTCLQPELHQELFYFSWWSSDFSLVASHQECSGTSGH